MKKLICSLFVIIALPSCSVVGDLSPDQIRDLIEVLKPEVNPAK